MFGIGVPELIVILIIGLVLFGPGKLPEVGRAVGKSINELKKATAGISDTTTVQQTPPAAKPEAQAPAQNVQTAETKTAETKIADK
ncbi:twin-arginine translocase TatA/TatE family subunit [Pectinatus cerevisiiphilus]|uniref:Sec-independent protein translocase protein TatA n=1 Tax=Pectinatus cerevisiiphilus TaxID=86956 RepID=A0A4R3K2M5_9FIRM|nr:twin-arginine translocase TatA/TatE family subunit [Pectinatus cerevisiiphilus]TCS76686.1 sec-independent protein translocase protein TatA [Pectinatus cerevisiiphilus]